MSSLPPTYNILEIVQTSPGTGRANVNKSQAVENNGVLESMTTGNAVSSGNVHKGELYLAIYLQPKGQNTYARLIEDYSWAYNDPGWTGALPVSAGDLITLIVINSNANLLQVNATGRILVQQ